MGKNGLAVGTCPMALVFYCPCPVYDGFCGFLLTSTSKWPGLQIYGLYEKPQILTIRNDGEGLTVFLLACASDLLHRISFVQVRSLTSASTCKD